MGHTITAGELRLILDKVIELQGEDCEVYIPNNTIKHEYESLKFVCDYNMGFPLVYLRGFDNPSSMPHKQYKIVPPKPTQPTVELV